MFKIILYVKKSNNLARGNTNIPNSKSPFQIIGDWWKNLITGTGSYQDDGINFIGNDNGGGTLEFRDHANHLLGQVDLGSWLKFMNAWQDLSKLGWVPSPMEAVKGLANGKHEKLIKVLESIDNIGNAGEMGHGASEITKGSDNNQIFKGIKKGRIVYSKGGNVTVTSDSSAQCCAIGPATDTLGK